MTEWVSVQKYVAAPQGWVCPICGRVYAPTTPMCWYCGGETTTVQKTTGTAPEKEGDSHD